MNQNPRAPAIAMIATFLIALALLIPTTGDIGLTWDEPAYRHSQIVSARWWTQLGKSRSPADLAYLLDSDVLLYHWPYGRHGINFHPPLAGQLNLLTYSLFHGLLKDIPARRLATEIEFALAASLLCGFLARRSGLWDGVVAAASVLLMPRLYGQAHLIDTDTPGLLLWTAIAIAGWKGVEEPRGGLARAGVGILLGLCFVEKMAAVFVLLPLLIWLLGSGVSRWFRNRPDRVAALCDFFLTSGVLLLPLLIAGFEVGRLASGTLLPAPQFTNLYIEKPRSMLPDWWFVIPTILWLARRLAAHVWRGHPVLGRERPTLETWAAILGLAPLVGWLGNPAWWRETLPRLTHYAMLSFARQESLPPIQIAYFGEHYDFSLPWESGWVWIAITVPMGILVASLLGLLGTALSGFLDLLKRYFFIHLATLPALRLLPVPAHDGVRLLLPTFVFVAAFCGWGLISVADRIAVSLRVRLAWPRLGLSLVVLGSAAWELIGVHPFELSYYNALIGGPRGAWQRGFELAYWYDAFNPRTLDELNHKFPAGASVIHANELSTPPTFEELQTLGAIRPDIDLIGEKPEFRYRWLLTHDSKASAFSRLLFAMRPWYELRPPQLSNSRVATVASPEAASRAWALQLLTDDAHRSPPESPRAPAVIRDYLKPLARLWGDGLTRGARLAVHEPSFEWAMQDPQSLRNAARAIANRRTVGDDPDERKLAAILSRYDNPAAKRDFLGTLLRGRPEALVEAVEILIRKPTEVRRVLTRRGYTELDESGQSNSYLDDAIAPAA
jgi:hypothetical protein